MSNVDAEVVRCPAEMRSEALALVLGELAPSLRREMGVALLNESGTAELAAELLFVARRGTHVCGASWGQRQSGNVVVFWLPQLTPGEDAATAYALAEAVTAACDETSAEMMQVFLAAPSTERIKVLQHVGFRHFADLLYMAADTSQFPMVAPASELEYEVYDDTQQKRLMNLVERTYVGTLDCRELDGVRDLENVIYGYQSTGVYRPENWRFVRHLGRDIGVLLLADYPQAGHWELMYMALVPEVRGRGWGRQVARFAQWLARGVGVDRIVVAVDAANFPAVKMYQDCGFETWGQREVYVRVAKRD